MSEGNSIPERVVIFGIIHLSAEFEAVERRLETENREELALRVHNPSDISQLVTLLQPKKSSGSAFGLVLVMRDEGCALLDGNDIANVVLRSPLDGTCIAGVIAQEELASVAEELLLVSELHRINATRWVKSKPSMMLRCTRCMKLSVPVKPCIG